MVTSAQFFPAERAILFYMFFSKEHLAQGNQVLLQRESKEHTTI
jgi:hypothetical protein